MIYCQTANFQYLLGTQTLTDWAIMNETNDALNTRINLWSFELKALKLEENFSVNNLTNFPVIQRPNNT